MTLTWSASAGLAVPPPEGPFTEYLAPAVAQMIAAENARYGGAVETSWCGKWDGERVTEASLLFRGHNSAVPVASHDVRPGEIHIHSHPIHAAVFPSEADIHMARELADKAAGMLIVSWDCREGYLVRAPLSSRKLPTPRVWACGRFTLLYHRSK